MESLASVRLFFSTQAITRTGNLPVHNIYREILILVISFFSIAPLYINFSSAIN